MAFGRIRLVVVSSVLLAITGLMIVRPPILDRVLPPMMSGWLDGFDSLVATRTKSARASDIPADFLADSPDGLVATGPIAALAGNRPEFISTMISGYTTRIESDIPAEITTIRPILGCLLTPPIPGTVVGYATSGKSGLPLALSTYNDGHLAAAVQIFVDAYRLTGEPKPVAGVGTAYEGYDVAVTETRAPVYLILENASGNRIWNLHLADGARIERVILLGGDQAGIANLDPVVPVEVMLQDGLAACGVRPAHPFNPGHRLNDPDAGGSLSQTEAGAPLADHLARTTAYGIWFRDSFGVSAEETRAGFDHGTLSVVGPVPDEAGPWAVYAPLTASKIRTTQDKFFEIKGQVVEGGDFASRVQAIATSFAFGDLTTLRQGVAF